MGMAPGMASGTLFTGMAPRIGVGNRDKNGSPGNGTPKVTAGNGTGTGLREWYPGFGAGHRHWSATHDKDTGNPIILGSVSPETFPGTAWGTYPWERDWECYSRNSTAEHQAREQPLLDRDTARGGHDPPHPREDCVPPECPQAMSSRSRASPTALGTGRDTHGCTFWTWGSRGTQEHQ